jgi:hypothetical protein
MNKAINYTLPSGKKAVITVTPEKRWDGTITAEVSAMVEGVGTPQIDWRKPAGLPAWAVSAIGKLPLTADTDAAVQAACDEINAAHATHNQAAKAHIAALEAVTAHSKMIERAMAC